MSGQMLNDDQIAGSDSTFAVCVWVLTILMGSSAIKEPVIFFVPAATAGLTVIWLALYGVAAIALFARHQFDWVIWLFRYRLLLMIALLGALSSALWAIDAYLSVQRSVHLIGCALLAIFAGYSLSLATLLRTLLWTAIALVVLSIAAVYLVPALGVQAYEGELVWRGVFANKNSLGFWSTMTVTLCACQWPTARSGRSKFAMVLGFILGLLTLYESKSATSLIALITGLGVAGAITIGHKLKFSLPQQALLALLGLATCVVLIQAIDTYWLNSVLGRDSNLTGRGEVWAQTWDLIVARPLGGYGYGNLWNPTDSSLWIQKTYTNFSWVVYHAHNGLLQVASEIGTILTTVIILFILQQFLESIHCQNQLPNGATLFVIAYSIGFLLSNYSEARLMIDRDIYWLLYLAMPISLLLHPNKTTSNTTKTL